jgi:hypothetical protein
VKGREMNTATITDVRRSWDGVFLVLARCDACGRDVMHGGGSDPDAVASYLGHRVGHSRCDGYHLIDPHGVVPRRVAELRAERATGPHSRRCSSGPGDLEAAPRRSSGPSSTTRTPTP